MVFGLPTFQEGVIEGIERAKGKWYEYQFGDPDTWPNEGEVVVVAKVKNGQCKSIRMARFERIAGSDWECEFVGAKNGGDIDRPTHWIPLPQ